MKRFLVAALSACLLSTTANAAVIVRNYAITATFLSPAPIGTVHGSFSVTFDNAAAITAPTASGLALAHLDVDELNVGSPAYVYSASGDSLSIGSMMVSGGCYVFITTSYCLTVTHVSTDTPTASLFYIIGNGSSGSQFYASQVTISPLAAAVPEPATWAMMLAGIGAIGGAMRRRERLVAIPV